MIDAGKSFPLLGLEYSVVVFCSWNMSSKAITIMIKITWRSQCPEWGTKEGLMEVKIKTTCWLFEELFEITLVASHSVLSCSELRVAPFRIPRLLASLPTIKVHILPYAIQTESLKALGNYSEHRQKRDGEMTIMLVFWIIRDKAAVDTLLKASAFFSTNILKIHCASVPLNYFSTILE